MAVAAEEIAAAAGESTAAAGESTAAAGESTAAASKNAAPPTAVPPPPVQQKIVSQQTPQNSNPVDIDLIIALGIGLIAVNGIQNGQFKSILNAVWNGNITSSFRSDAIMLGGEILFIIGLSIFGQISQGTKKVALTTIIVLWFVWSIKNASTVAQWTGKLLSGVK